MTIQPFDLRRRLAAELLGTALLVATVVGSGIMAEKLTKDVGLQLLCNTIPTGAILYVLITILGPISGAHFNPVVTAVFAARHEISFREGVNYIAAQLLGGVIGTLLAHLMFAHGTFMASGTVRTGLDQWLAEFVATFGLITVIFGGIRFRPAAVPALVGLYITAAYWFTASTSFANPAVAIARSLTDTFSGIRPMDLPGFLRRDQVQTCCGASIGGPLHHCRLLVYGFNVFRKPGGGYRPQPHRHVLRNTTSGPARLRGCRICRRFCGDVDDELAFGSPVRPTGGRKPGRFHATKRRITVTDWGQAVVNSWICRTLTGASQRGIA